MTIWIQLWRFRLNLGVLDYSVNYDSYNYFRFGIAWGKYTYGFAWRKNGRARVSNGPSEIVRIYI